MRAVYVDKYSSKLDDPQVETTNLMLFNMKRRFEQASYQNTKKAPMVENTIQNVSNKVSELTLREYDKTIFASFILNINSKETNLWSFKGEKQIVSIKACGVNSYEFASETLPGYFFLSNKNLIFRKTTDVDSLSFFITLYMEEKDGS